MFDETLLEKKIFKTAFTHRSYLNESSDSKESNERLEFLGDSILSFIISCFLFEKRPGDAEGDLTNLRSYIVKTQSLAKASKNLDLGRYLMLSKGEEVTGGRDNTQLLANTYEAVIGAYFVEFGIDKTTQFVHETLLPLFAGEIENGPPKDAKSQLQEQTQVKFKQSPKYKIIGTSGPDHAKKFKVGVYVDNNLLGTGEGLSKQVAEEEAATKALGTTLKS